MASPPVSWPSSYLGTELASLAGLLWAQCDPSLDTLQIFTRTNSQIGFSKQCWAFSSDLRTEISSLSNLYCTEEEEGPDHGRIAGQGQTRSRASAPGAPQPSSLSLFSTHTAALSHVAFSPLLHFYLT